MFVPLCILYSFAAHGQLLRRHTGDRLLRLALLLVHVKPHGHQQDGALHHVLVEVRESGLTPPRSAAVRESNSTPWPVNTCPEKTRESNNTIGMPGPVERMTAERIPVLAQALMEAANAISARLSQKDTTPRG